MRCCAVQDSMPVRQAFRKPPGNDAGEVLAGAFMND